MKCDTAEPRCSNCKQYGKECGKANCQESQGNLHFVACTCWFPLGKFRARNLLETLLEHLENLVGKEKGKKKR